MSFFDTLISFIDSVNTFSYRYPDTAKCILWVTAIISIISIIFVMINFIKFGKAKDLETQRKILKRLIVFLVIASICGLVPIIIGPWGYISLS